MKKLSSLASGVAPEIHKVADIIKITKPPKISKPSKSKHRHQNPTEASSTGKPEFKDSNFDSISTPKAHISSGEQIDHRFFSEFLSRKDWYLLLNHEFKARRVNLNTQIVVSVLQNQENALWALRFYVWLSTSKTSLAKNKPVLSALSSALFRKGPVLLSAELIQEIRNSGCRLNEDLLCALIGSWGRLGLAKYCSAVFEQVSYLGIFPSTRLYNAVIDGLVKSNSLDLAYLKFQQMEVDNCIRDRFTYNILIHGVCKAGVVDEALRLVKQMEGLGYLPNVFTYTILLDGYLIAKRINEAFSLLERMKARNVRPNDATYRSLINGVFRTLPPLEAFELLSTWVNQDPNLPKVVYGSIIYCLCNNTLPKQATAFLKTAEKRGYVPDISTTNIALTCLVKGLDLNETCRIFDYFIERGVKMDLSTCLALVEALCKSGREEKGSRYLSWAIREELVTNVFSYNMVIDCLCKSTTMDKALEAFGSMSERGAVVKAMKLLRKMQQVDGIRPDVYTFNALIQSYCKANKIGKAQRLLKSMLSMGFHPDNITYIAFVNSLCESRRFIEAQDLFNSMEENGCRPDAYTCSSYIDALVKSGRFKEARDVWLKCEEKGMARRAYNL